MTRTLTEWQGALTLKQTVQALFFQNKKLARVKIKSYVWAAKTRNCPKCEAEPYQRCMNMADVKKARADLGWGAHSARVRATKWPHDDRIDWQRLYDALVERGYVE